MIKSAFVWAVAAAAAVAAATAEEFPLSFKAIPAKDIQAFPGSYGLAAPLRQTKPATLTHEPKAISRHPLYGEFRGASSGPGLIFRLDESKGDGKGYDRIIVDMNQNGDLTDDAVVERVDLPTTRKNPSPTVQERCFGPIEGPADKTIAGGRPICFAQGYVYNLNTLSSSLWGRAPSNVTYGYLRLKAGWYLETTVTLNGLKQKVGLFDGDCNFHLGDVSRPQTYGSGEDRSWSFHPADSLLVDADGSGAFESGVFQPESAPFGSILYLGSTPYKVALAAECSFLKVEPWTEPLAEVTLQPHGNQVHSLTLAWERSSGQWQLITPVVADGKIKVPPGNYRLYTCGLLGKAAPASQVMALGYERTPKEAFNFAAGQTNTLSCGAPLEVQVTAAKRKPESWERDARTSFDPKSDSEFVLSINAKVRGAGGELYSTYGKGEKFDGDPPKPAFTIVGAEGDKIGSGNLEFG